MKYDFSGISTEKLRGSIEFYLKGDGRSACKGLNCNDSCPFYVANFHCADDYETRHEEFKAELERRENMNNEMPELKAGMIVEHGGNFGIVLPINRFGEVRIYSLDGGESYIQADRLTKIYYNRRTTYKGIFNSKSPVADLDLVWSRKSDKDIKIEELEKTIKDAQKTLDEALGLLKELKS